METVAELAAAAKAACGDMAAARGEQKNRVLLTLASLIEQNERAIIDENREDLADAREDGLSEAMLERLTLNKGRVQGMAESLRSLAMQADPVGEVVFGSVRPNGLRVTQRRVPLGLIAVIYESRPNVTVDVAALCIKSGNAAILRGGHEAINSNIKLTELIKKALAQNGLPPDAVALVTDTSRESANELMSLTGVVDLLIPRGGRGLIQTVVKNAKVPVIETGAGNCHVYVDAAADLDMALNIAENARMSRPSVCNSAEKLLVHASIAEKFLPMLEQRLSGRCELRACERAARLLEVSVPATEEDWYTEYNDYILGVKVAEDVTEAVRHINKYGTHHSEAIVTGNVSTAEYFLEHVDAAAVYLNASTRFTDGGEFGMSAEIGVSTAKLHARGPMGLRALTTTKFVVIGDGQIR